VEKFAAEEKKEVKKPAKKEKEEVDSSGIMFFIQGASYAYRLA